MPKNLTWRWLLGCEIFLSRNSPAPKTYGSSARLLDLYFVCLFLGFPLVCSAVAHCGPRLAGIKKDWRESGCEDAFVAILVA